MNLNYLLSCLKESVDIEKLNNDVKDDVPESVLSALSAKMKGKKYDPTATAIIKRIQKNKREGMPGQIAEYLVDHPLFVYNALRAAAKGNSNFDPNKVMDDAYHFTNMSGRNYWYSVYKGDFRSDDKKEHYGIKNARVKELDDVLLYFPKTYKMIGKFGIKVEDYDKQWKDLRNLSAQMAEKDTSGDIFYDKDGEEINSKVNHWCVASSDDGMYKSYKDNALRGLFVIVVKKNSKGGPDYNKRYLYYTDGIFDDENTIAADGEEFADKLNRHIRMSDVLSPKTISFLRNLTRNYTARDERKDKEKIEPHRRINNAYQDYVNNANKVGGEEWDAFRKLIDIINEWVDKQNRANGKLTYEEAVKKLVSKTKNYKGLLKLFSGNDKKEPPYACIYQMNNFKFDLAARRTGTWLYGITIWVGKEFGNQTNSWEVRDSITSRNSGEELYDRLVSYAKQLKDVDEYIPGTIPRLKFDIYKKYFHPANADSYKDDEKYLSGNKKLIDHYKKYKDSQIRRSFSLGDCGLALHKAWGRYIIGSAKTGNEICKLTDPNMPQKVREYIQGHLSADEIRKDDIPF